MGEAAGPDELDGFEALVERREERVPLAYITGRKEFWSMDFEVDGNVLIPRPETEHVVEHALRLLAGVARPRIADVGTGAGPIAVALARERPDAVIDAVDLSAGALEVARRNARRHAVEGRIRFHLGDALGPLLAEGHEGTLDLVASNPPYVARREASSVQEEVRRWEPEMAVFAGEMGDEVIRRLIPQAARCLRPGGHAVIEISLPRSEGVRGIFAADGIWESIAEHDDLAGLPRVVTARRREGRS